MIKIHQPILLCIFTILIITACQKAEKIVKHPDLSYSKIKDIDIKFMSDELADLHHIQRVNSCKLASFNRNHQELITFSYCDQAKDKKIIKLPKDGPNYLGQMDGAYYLNKDSIFFSSDTEL